MKDEVYIPVSGRKFKVTKFGVKFSTVYIKVEVEDYGEE